jgi:hypothetical protein
MITRRTAAAIRLQRSFRAWPRDPISLGLVRKRFALLRNDNLLVFDAHTFAKWVTTSGDFRDPIAREELAEHERMRLQRLSGVPLPVQELAHHYADETRRRQLIAYLCDEIIEAEFLPLDAISNLHRVVRSREELHLIYRSFERHGLFFRLVGETARA